MSKDLKNVVIIGASSAGAAIARNLEKKLPSTHRIILIDAAAYSYFPIAALRAAVVPGWEDQVFASLDGFFPSTSRHVVLPETRVVQLGDGFIEVNRANEAKGLSTQIDFDFAVLATGSTYGSPMRLIADSTAQAKEVLRSLQQDIKSANNLVLVGGGSVGIEFAGEILERYPKKKVTLIQSTDRLLSDKWPIKLSQKLERDLKEMGAEIVYGERVDKDVLDKKAGAIRLKNGQTIEADLIFNTAGTKANSQLISAQVASAVDSHGFVKVDDTLKVASKEGPFVSSKYFAAGDVADSPGGPTAIAAANDAGVVAKNILSLLSNASKPLTKVGAPLNLIAIPVGSKRGQSMLPFGVVGNWITSTLKGGSLFVSKFHALYPSKLEPETASSYSTLYLVGTTVVGATVAFALSQNADLFNRIKLLW